MTTKEVLDLFDEMYNGNLTFDQARSEVEAIEKRRSASGERARMVSHEDEFQDDPEVQLGGSVVAETD